MKTEDIWYNAKRICPRVEKEVGSSRDVIVSDGEKVSIGYYYFDDVKQSDGWISFGNLFEILFWKELPPAPFILQRDSEPS